MKEYSKYQLSIFDDVEHGSGNTGVNAVAGSGKTTTAVDSIYKIPSFYRVQYNAFGKDIAAELTKRNLPKNCSISTYNAFGWGIVRRFFNPCQLDKKKTENILQYSVLGSRQEDEDSWKKFCKFRYPIIRLVSLLKGQCVFTAEEAYKKLPELIEHYGIEAPTEPDFIDSALRTFDCSINHRTKFDFDDQIYQVHKHDLMVPSSDFVFVDEFQDTNDMQCLLMEKASHGGRFFGIGDPDQSVYGFRGATPDAFGKFINKFQAKLLPLSICYRCPKSVVLEAQKIVPRIEYASWARDGTVDSISTDQFKSMVRPGDFVLCRTIAPLVKRCLENIRDGIPARILGRDIGDDLEYLIDRISGKSYFMSVTMFKDLLNEYVQAKLASYAAINAENLAMQLEDKAMTIESLMEDCKSVSDIIRRIHEVFSENVEHCIKYMSIHKSKGLECEMNVFVLRPDLLPHPRAKKDWQKEEEKRLKYVAITRTKNGLYWVRKEEGEK